MPKTFGQKIVVALLRSSPTFAEIYKDLRPEIADVAIGSNRQEQDMKVRISKLESVRKTLVDLKLDVECKECEDKLEDGITIVEQLKRDIPEVAKRKIAKKEIEIWSTKLSQAISSVSTHHGGDGSTATVARPSEPEAGSGQREEPSSEARPQDTSTDQNSEDQPPSQPENPRGPSEEPSQTSSSDL